MSKQPTAKSIAANIALELREHPERWMQGALVKFASGIEDIEPELVTCDDAISWCLEGHIMRRCSGRRLTSVMDDFRSKCGDIRVNRWHDKRGRKVSDVIALCERVVRS